MRVGFLFERDDHRERRRRRLGALAATAAAAVLLASPQAPAASNVTAGSASGLPVPRFVSLKSDRVNVRAGPTKDHEVTWIYTRSGLPVEVVAEFENWRRIRDWEGAEGWVYHSLLSGRRTAIVLPPAKAREELVPVHFRAAQDSDVAAQLQPGVLTTVKTCQGTWCRVAGSGFDGWIAQNRLWGVYPNEQVD